MKSNDFNLEDNSLFKNSINTNTIKSNKTNQDYNYNNNELKYENFSSKNTNYNPKNNFVFYGNKKTQLRSPNDFIFLGDELHLYREIPHIGNFYSYKNKSVKGIFLDKTICMMNQDQFYAKVINKYGDKELLYIPDLPASNPYYIYIKNLFDFYDACFNPEVLQNNAKKKLELERQINQRINKIDDFNNLIFNKSKEENYSKQYYMDNIPTMVDVENLLKRNQKALDNIEKMKYQNNNDL